MDIKKYKYIIGIDPDCGSSPDEYGIATKGGSGVCIYNTDTQGVRLLTLNFCELMTVLVMRQDKPEVLVAVEASWLTYNPSTNWHGKTGESKGVLARKGYDVGRCHEVGRKIVEVARTSGYDVEMQKPLKKVWKGEDGKISDEELRRIIHIDKGRTNQEERDATLIALHVANHPMHMKTAADESVPAPSKVVKMRSCRAAANEQRVNKVLDGAKQTMEKAKAEANSELERLRAVIGRKESSQPQKT